MLVVGSWREVDTTQVTELLACHCGNVFAVIQLLLKVNLVLLLMFVCAIAEFGISNT